MPKKISEESYNSILKTVGKFPDGAAISQIIATLQSTAAKRTLQRHIATLVERGLLITEGKTVGRKYKLPSKGR